MRGKCENLSSPAGTRVSEDRGGDDAVGAGVEIFLQAIKTRLLLCNPWRTTAEQISTQQTWRTSFWGPEM